MNFFILLFKRPWTPFLYLEKFLHMQTQKVVKKLHLSFSTSYFFVKAINRIKTWFAFFLHQNKKKIIIMVVDFFRQFLPIILEGSGDGDFGVIDWVKSLENNLLSCNPRTKTCKQKKNKIQIILVYFMSESICMRLLDGLKIPF